METGSSPLPRAPQRIVFSVKAGHLVPTYLRDLRDVIGREEAEIGVLISFEEPTAGMRSEAASAGFYTSPWGKHPRLHGQPADALELFGPDEAAEDSESYDSN